MTILNNFSAKRVSQLGLVLILIAYFLPWIKHETAGLTLIGIDVSEWSKFLPQMGGLGNRDWFYLPPITLGILISLSTVDWPNRRWQTWLVRGVAIGVAWLAFPSLDAIRFEDASQWRPRLMMVGFVVLFAMVTPLIRRLPRWGIELIRAVTIGVGLVLPTLLMLRVHPVMVDWLKIDVAIGIGVWLNVVAHSMAAAAGFAPVRD